MVTYPMLTPILQAAALSALTTDYYQSRHWIEGTPLNPVPTPAGGYVYEANPLVAGRPEALESCVKLLQTGIEAAPRMLSPPLATLMLGGFAIHELATILRNNQLAREQGLPRYWMLAYRCGF